MAPGLTARLSPLLLLVAARLSVSAYSTFTCPDDCTLQPHLPCTLSRFRYDCPFEVVERQAWPGNPYKLNVIGYNNSRKGISLNITWYPPYDWSVHYLEGFEVSLIHTHTMGDQQCFSFKMDKANWTMDDIEQQFYIDCIHGIKDTMLITVYSMPRMRCKSDPCEPEPPQALSIEYKPPPYNVQPTKATDQKGKLTREDDTVYVTAGIQRLHQDSSPISTSQLVTMKQISNSSKAVIYGVTMGTVAIVVMTTVAVFIFCRRRKTNGYNTAVLSRKRVFVIVSCGDERHQRVAGWFCLFLNGCCCDVKVNLRYNSLLAPNFQADMQEADKIILINSEDAFLKFRDYMTTNKEEEDKFTTSILLMKEMWHEDRNTIDNTAVIRFPYTEDKFVIKELLTEGVRNFKMMADVRKLLCFIHDVDILPRDLESAIESDSRDVEDNYPSNDSGVCMEVPLFVGPNQPNGTETITVRSEDIMDVLDKINSSDSKNRTLSFGSVEEQRIFALNAFREESDSLLTSDLTSINIGQSLALLNSKRADELTLDCEIPDFTFNIQDPNLDGNLR